MDINFGSLISTLKSHLSALENRYGHLKEEGGFAFSDASAQVWHDTLSATHAALTALHEGAEPAIASAIRGSTQEINTMVAEYLAPMVEQFQKSHVAQLEAVDAKLAAFVSGFEAKFNAALEAIEKAHAPDASDASAEKQPAKAKAAKGE